MTSHQRARTRRRALASACVVTATVAFSTLTLGACGSPDPSPAASPTAAVKTAIIKVLPRDAAAEPPWNGRFVQVNVRVPEPGTMEAEDWHVFVNGRQPRLDKAANILPYSPSEAVVAFMFQQPCTDLGTYDFRVVYAPKGGKKVQLAWRYER